MTTCLIKVHDTTGDADLYIYKDNMRTDEPETYYLEDGGLSKAIEVAKTITSIKPVIRRI